MLFYKRYRYFGHSYGMCRALIVVGVNVDLIVDTTAGHGFFHAMLAALFGLLFVTDGHARYFATAIMQVYRHAGNRQTVQTQEQYGE